MEKRTNRRLLIIIIALTIVCGINQVTVAAPKETNDRRNTISLEYQYWRPDASLTLQNGAFGTQIDAFSTLGLTNYNIPTANLTWSNKDGREYRLGYTNIQYNGDLFLANSFVYGGSVFNVNANIVSNFKLNAYKVETKVPFRRNGDLAFLYGIGFYSYSASLGERTASISGPGVPGALQNATAPAASVSTGYSAILPLVGLAYETHLGEKVSLYAEGRGYFPGNIGYIYDFAVGLQYHFSKSIAAGFGYRDMQIRYNGNVSSFDGQEILDSVYLHLNGPFFNLAYSF